MSISNNLDSHLQMEEKTTLNALKMASDLFGSSAFESSGTQMPSQFQMTVKNETTDSPLDKDSHSNSISENKLLFFPEEDIEYSVMVSSDKSKPKNSENPDISSESNSRKDNYSSAVDNTRTFFSRAGISDFQFELPSYNAVQDTTPAISTSPMVNDRLSKLTEKQVTSIKKQIHHQKGVSSRESTWMKKVHDQETKKRLEELTKRQEVSEIFEKKLSARQKRQRELHNMSQQEETEEDIVSSTTSSNVLDPLDPLESLSRMTLKRKKKNKRKIKRYI